MKLVLFAMILSLTNLVAKAAAIKEKDISYGPDTRNTLDVYHSNGEKQDVIIYFHGGSWDSGRKDIYWWLGRTFAKRGVVTAIVNYRLSPAAGYKEMANDAALSVKWITEHISEYGGDPKRIFLMCHSAGAHLAELINADPRYFKELGIVNPVKGLILNDAFGLDMHEYLVKAEKDHYYQSFIKTFTATEETWKEGSPMTYIQNVKNPHLVLWGGSTYGAIKIQSPRLVETLQQQGVPVESVVVKGKKHVPMISQMVLPNNMLYKLIVDFIRGH